MQGARTLLLTRGHDTNNYCEISARLLNDAILDTRARSLGQLLRVLTVDLDTNYSSRLMDFSSSRKNVSYLYYKSPPCNRNCARLILASSEDASRPGARRLLKSTRLL